MTLNYTSFAGLMFHENQLSTLSTNSVITPLLVRDYYITAVIEIFTHSTSIERAYQAYKVFRVLRATAEQAPPAPILRAFDKGFGRNALLFIHNRVIVCPDNALYTAYQIETAARSIDAEQQNRVNELRAVHKILDLTDLSRSTSLVASTMLTHYLSASVDYPDLTLEEFTSLVRALFVDGLLTAPVEAIDFGHFKRMVPFCPDFGFSRGTPIDRYYLNKFIEQIRDDVVGDTLEIGGAKPNRQRYNFIHAKSYRALDMSEAAGVDIIGDAHNPNIIQPCSLDSIIIFNVLEHCEKPWIVANNMYDWLREGGKVFCMVPNAQRLHKEPRDFWRFMPDALKLIFSNFCSVRLLSYGNPITSISSMMGVAAEELSSEELDSVNEAYPVATCAVAQKSAGMYT